MAATLAEYPTAYVETSTGNYGEVQVEIYENWVRIRTDERTKFVPASEVLEVSWDH